MTARARRAIVCFFGRARNPHIYNNQLHLGFFEGAFARHGYRLIHHGPVVHRSDDGPVAFAKGRNSLRRLIAKVRPAALMIFEGKDAAWALAQAPGSMPKFVYAVDVHRMRSVHCYRGADAIIVRAKRFERTIRALPGGRQLGPCRWFPFSVNMSAVGRAAAREPVRDPRVVFCGSQRSEPYPLRHLIVTQLRAQGLLSSHSAFSAGLPFGEYSARLKSALVGLATTGRWRLNMAKHVEIPACGTCLLTNGGLGTDEMIPAHLYVKFDSVADAVAKAKMLVSTPAGRERAARLGAKARAHVLAHHTDELRAKQILAFLRETLSL